MKWALTLFFVPTMSYAPGTKLSYNNGNNCCTVLRDGNSLVTMVNGKEFWEQMWLADWLILADGKETAVNTVSYPPGTKLSYNDGKECCTVLTQGNVLITMIWGEWEWRQMSLADWLILADGKEKVYTDSETICPQPKRLVGTKLTWTYDDYKIVAIITKKGVIQVKYAWPEGVSYDKVFFDSEQSWRESLPNYGDVAVAPFQ